MIKFKPKLSFNEIKYCVNDRLIEKQIKNEVLYNSVKALTQMFYPSSKTKFEKRWVYFYLPVKRDGKLISIPFFIMKYKGNFHVYFKSLGGLKISKGKDEIEKIYKDIFKETKRFIPLIKSTNGNIIEKTVPYDFRTGKIKGKYIMDKIMPNKEKLEILKLYNDRIKRNLEVTEISLNDYLNVAGICYKASYKEAKKLSPLEMYKRLADGRHGGMLDIKDSNSKKQFMKWSNSGKWAGSHPFEIVFSWHEHGIHLYPPRSENHCYSLFVTNYAYASKFIKMVKALIKNKISFHANKLDDALDYLTGEKDFTVNGYDKLRFIYIPLKENKKLYFKYIKWEKLKIAKIKRSQEDSLYSNC